MEKSPKIELLKKKNYLAMIRNAARGENNMFRNLYMLINGAESDGTADGALSCAAFVTSILYLMNSQLADPRNPQDSQRLIGYVHASVPATEKDLLRSGWRQVKEPRPGAILIWSQIKGRPVPVYGDMHNHIGFYIGDEKAVSNDSDGRGVPAEHHWTYNGGRAVERIYWHEALEEH